MRTLAGSYSNPVYMMLNSDSLTIKNQGPHRVLYGGFQIAAGETLTIQAHNMAWNRGHWRRVMEDFDLLHKVHHRRWELCSRWAQELEI